MKPKPKVTVYIPSHNYGRFLRQAVQSVADQIYKDWELIIIDDGSTDETSEIAQSFQRSHPDRIRLIHHPNKRGLQTSANAAIDRARGEYVIRLDPDDFFDEAALLVMASYLDNHPDIALVYPNYIYINEEGDFLGIENHKKVEKEAKVLDLPAHGACTMIRKRVLKSIGGYNESYKAQDGHEIWLKILHRYKVENISTPLFFYRQHSDSVSRNEKRIFSSRRSIKQDLAKKNAGKVKLNVVAIIPAKNTYKDNPDVALQEIAGKPLIDYTLKAAQKSGVFGTILVTTDDPKVVAHCNSFKNVTAVLRTKNLSAPDIGLSKVVADSVRRMEQELNIYPDILVVLSIHCPLRRPENIREAVDTLLLYNLENVVSVCENYDLLFKHGENGLELVNKGMMNRLRLEREALYLANGAIFAFWRELAREDSFYGRKIGHIVMELENSFQMRSVVESEIVKRILEQRNKKGADFGALIRRRR
jgi:glycosyltransferase involved in cell wall biosynthesis